MARLAIEAQEVTKTFAGGVVAVHQLDLAVEAGAVYGLIGRNGVGKTTTLRLLMGLLRPTRGSTRVLGADLHTASRAVRSRVAYVSQTQHLPGELSLQQHARCFAHLYPCWDDAHARALARNWELSWTEPLGRLSAGKQRLAAILLAFASRPEILLLDEPAAGLDPLARRGLVNAVVDAVSRNGGCTVLFSTHILSDLERVAEHLGIMDRGRVLLSTRLEDLLNTTKRVQVIFEGESAPAGYSVPNALHQRVSGPVVTAVVRLAPNQSLESMRTVPGARVNVFHMGLEDILLHLLEAERPSATASVEETDAMQITE